MVFIWKDENNIARRGASFSAFRDDFGLSLQDKHLVLPGMFMIGRVTARLDVDGMILHEHATVRCTPNGYEALAEARRTLDQ